MCSARLISSGNVSCALARTLTRALRRGCGSSLAAGTLMTTGPLGKIFLLSYFSTRPATGIRRQRLGSGPLRGGREQAKSTGPVEGLQAAVGSELVVQVPHVRPDRVHRHVKLAGDLRRGKAALQEAQDPGLGLAQWLGQVLSWARGWRRWRPPAQHADDLPDQRGVRGALPGMAFKQLRHRVQQEREEEAIRLGEMEPSLEGSSGGLPLTERVPGARLQQESRDLPHLMGSRNRGAEDGRERGDRRLRVVLGEAQRSQGGADTWPFAFGFGHL